MQIQAQHVLSNTYPNLNTSTAERNEDHIMSLSRLVLDLVIQEIVGPELQQCHFSNDSKRVEPAMYQIMITPNRTLTKECLHPSTNKSYTINRACWTVKECRTDKTTVASGSALKKLMTNRVKQYRYIYK